MPTFIIKYILDLKINLTISKLLALALIIKKQLTKGIIKDEIIYFQVNILKSNTINAQNSYL